MRRYLGDANALRLHDFARERPECGLGAVVEGRRRWYTTVEDAMRDADYELCPWCAQDAGGAHFGVTARGVLSRRMSLAPA